MRNRGIALTLMAAAVVAVACGSDDTPTGTAAVVAVTVSAPNAAIFVGATSQLTATAKDASGNAVSGATVTWSSSSDAIATVSPSGLVTGVAPGTATITATSNGKTGTTSLTIASKTVSLTATMTPAGSATGSVVLNAALPLTPQINGDSLKKLLLAGATYVNIHTVSNGGGEIRAQITKK